MSIEKIEFYKLRDFGEKMSATVDFIRSNFKKLFLSVLLIGGPVALLMSLVFKDMLSNAFDFTNGAGFDYFANLGIDYLLMIFLSWMAMMMIVSITYHFMMKYNNDDLEDFSIGDLFGTAVKKLPGLVLLSFLIVIVAFVGFLFLIIPGIYLSVVLSLAYPVYLFDKNAGIGEAFSRPFRLIKDKWWSTFGVLFVGAIMANIVSLIFSIPFSIVYVGSIFTLVKEGGNDPTVITDTLTTGYMTFAMALSEIGKYVSYSIPLIALGYQYSNLVERTEGKGLLAEIHDFDKSE